MRNRILTMMLAAVMILGIMIPVVTSASEIMYVYTENGRSLNIRYGPSPEADILTTVPFGSEIVVDYHMGNGWTAIYWDNEVYFVQTRFLTYTRPGGRPSPSGGGSSSYTGGNSADINELNRIFRTYKQVANPYRITVRPTRASGWVNLRFAPSKQTELMGTYKNNDQLLVIAELQGWYQVEDPNTGTVGYMDSAYTVR